MREVKEKVTTFLLNIHPGKCDPYSKQIKINLKHFFIKFKPYREKEEGKCLSNILSLCSMCIQTYHPTYLPINVWKYQIFKSFNCDSTTLLWKYKTVKLTNWKITKKVILQNKEIIPFVIKI